jgi:hypothetical protein
MARIASTLNQAERKFSAAREKAFISPGPAEFLDGENGHAKT